MRLSADDRRFARRAGVTADIVLFDLLWGDEAACAAASAALSDDDWARLDVIAGQHRLRPLLYHRSTVTGAIAVVPESIGARWRGSHRRAALLALRQRVELVRIARLFEEAGIEGRALKGASIVWRGWIDPALRPMRDLDILVAEDIAAHAHALLRRHGFVGDTADSALSDKHLPGLKSPETRVPVEVHTRLAAPRHGGWTDGEAKFRGRALRRAAAADTAPGGMAGLGTTDTLLHVIMHGVLDHQFNNGPLMLLDIAQLVAHGEIDWPCFWTEAQALDVVRACQLSLGLAERYTHLDGVDWADHRSGAPSADVIDAAAAMMLVDLDRRSELGWIGRLAEGSGGSGRDYLRALIGRSWRASGGARPLPGGNTRFRRIGAMIATVGRYATALYGRKAQRHVRRSLKVSKWLRGD